MIASPHTRRVTISRKAAPCPRCGEMSGSHSFGRRRLHEIGVSKPTVLHVTYSKHYCGTCRKHFSLSMDHLAPPAGRFTHRVRRAAVDLVLRHALTLGNASRHMRRRYWVHVPPTTIHDWVVEALAMAA